MNEIKAIDLAALQDELRLKASRLLQENGWENALVRALPRGDWPILCVGRHMITENWNPDERLLKKIGMKARLDDAGLRLNLTDNAWNRLFLDALDALSRIDPPLHAPLPAFEPPSAYAYARTQWLLRVAPEGEFEMPPDAAARKTFWCALGANGGGFRLREAETAFLALLPRIPPTIRLKRLTALRGVAMVCAAAFYQGAGITSPPRRGGLTPI